MQLTQREKTLLVVAAVFLSGFLAWLGVGYLNSHVFIMEDTIDEIRQNEIELDNIGERYLNLRKMQASGNAQLDMMQPQLEEILRRVGIYERARMKTADVTIENQYLKREVTIEIKEITSLEMLELIKAVENNSMVTFVVESFYTRPNIKKQGFNWMRLTVAAMEKRT